MRSWFTCPQEPQDLEIADEDDADLEGAESVLGSNSQQAALQFFLYYENTSALTFEFFLFVFG